MERPTLRRVKVFQIDFFLRLSLLVPIESTEFDLLAALIDGAEANGSAIDESRLNSEERVGSGDGVRAVDTDSSPSIVSKREEDNLFKVPCGESSRVERVSWSVSSESDQPSSIISSISGSDISDKESWLSCTPIAEGV